MVDPRMTMALNDNAQQTDDEFDADILSLMEWGFDRITSVSFEALKEEELKPLPEEEDWN